MGYYERYDQDFDVNYNNECVEEEYGCTYCWDKRKKTEKQLFFFDHANNLRVCHYCPNCGRQYIEDK